MTKILSVSFYSLVAIMLLLVLIINPENHLTFAYLLFALNVFVMILSIFNYIITKRKAILVQIAIALLALFISGFELHVAEYNDDVPKLQFAPNSGA